MSKQFYGKYGPGRNADNAPFPKRRVTVTLTGEEWFTLVTQMTGRELSTQGQAIRTAAVAKLTKQLLKAQRD